MPSRTNPSAERPLNLATRRQYHPLSISQTSIDAQSLLLCDGRRTCPVTDGIAYPEASDFHKRKLPLCTVSLGDATWDGCTAIYIILP